MHVYHIDMKCDPLSLVVNPNLGSYVCDYNITVDWYHAHVSWVRVHVIGGEVKVRVCPCNCPF